MEGEIEKNSSVYLKDKIEELFYGDLRSLALLRVGVSIILLANLLTRLGGIAQYYTDSGIVPRSIIASISHPFTWSIYFLNGSYAFSLFIFILTAIFALLLLVGYKTKYVSIISFILYLSLVNRSPMINDGSDLLLQVILFWGIFLPWNSRYSIDAAKSKVIANLPNRVFSFGIFGYFIQICLVYISTSLFKSGPEWTQNYNAIYYVYNYQIFAVPWAKFFLSYPLFLQIITFSVKWFELFGTLFFFFPFKTSAVRIIAIVLFMSMHVGIASTMFIGLFPFISIISFFGLLPSLFWEKLFNWLSNFKKFKIKIYYDSECGFCWNIVSFSKTFFLLPTVELIPASSDPEVLELMLKENSFVVEENSGKRHIRSQAIFTIVKASPLAFPFAQITKIPGVNGFIDKIYNFIAKNRHAVCPVHYEKVKESNNNIFFSFPVNILALLFIMYIFTWNIQNFVPQVKIPMSIGYLSGVSQSWPMFSPSPPRTTGWNVIVGHLKNGSDVNLLSPNEPITYKEPENISLTYDYRFKNISTKLNQNSDYRHFDIYKKIYADYLCRDWNTKHVSGEKLINVTINFMFQHIPPPGQSLSRAKNSTLLNYSCK